MEVAHVIERILHIAHTIDIKTSYANAERMALKMHDDNSYFSDNHIKCWLEHLKSKRWEFDLVRKEADDG